MWRPLVIGGSLGTVSWKICSSSDSTRLSTSPLSSSTCLQMRVVIPTLDSLSQLHIIPSLLVISGAVSCLVNTHDNKFHRGLEWVWQLSAFKLGKVTILKGALYCFWKLEVLWSDAFRVGPCKDSHAYNTKAHVLIKHLCQSESRWFSFFHYQLYLSWVGLQQQWTCTEWATVTTHDCDQPVTSTRLPLQSILKLCLCRKPERKMFLKVCVQLSMLL